MRKWVAICAILLLGVSSSQWITRGYIYSEIGTLFTWSGAAQSSWSGSGQWATCNDYLTYIQNSGGTCGTSGGQWITYGTAVSLAVNSTTVLATTDPWLTDSGTYWPNQSGTASFGTLPGGSVPGQVAGATFVEASSSSTSVVVWQSLQPTSVTSGSTITVSAYLYSSTQSVTGSGCAATGGTSTATASATVEILNASGTREAFTTDSSADNQFDPKNVTLPVTVTGQYYAAVVVSYATGTSIPTGGHIVSGSCVGGTTKQAITTSEATDIQS